MHLLTARSRMRASNRTRASFSIASKNHAREHVALTREHAALTREYAALTREHAVLTREHRLTARWKGVNAREYVIASIKFKSSGTVLYYKIMQTCTVVVYTCDQMLANSYIPASKIKIKLYHISTWPFWPIINVREVCKNYNHP